MRGQVVASPGPALDVMRDSLRGGAAFEDEYPLVFGAGFPGSFVVVEDDRGAAGGCAFLHRTLQFPAGSLDVGLIGSVCTREDRRGRGIASGVLRDAEAELASKGAALAILWAEDADFYTRRGYQAFGAEIDFAVPFSLLDRLPTSSRAREARDSDAEWIHALYEQHEARARRSLAETRALLGVPGMQVRVHETAGVVDAYACYERGEDLSRVVHEWAGSADGVLACMREWLAAVDADEAIFLMSPCASSELVQRLEALGAPSSVGVLGMAKVLDAERLLDEMCAAASDPITFQSLEGGSWRVVGRGGVVELTRERILDLVLPPGGDRTALGAFENILGVTFPGLPRMPFLWGLDSI